MKTFNTVLVKWFYSRVWNAVW